MARAMALILNGIVAWIVGDKVHLSVVGKQTPQRKTLHALGRKCTANEMFQKL